MADSFREILMREAKEEIHYSIRNRILGMIPEKVRKIVGWILIIFGTVVMLGGVAGVTVLRVD